MLILTSSIHLPVRSDGKQSLFPSHQLGGVQRREGEARGGGPDLGPLHPAELAPVVVAPAVHRATAGTAVPPARPVFGTSVGFL